jgi:hypothetical protein
MVGSSWFADQNWDRLRKHAVAYLQIDQPACVGTSIWQTHSNAELKSFHEGIEAEMLQNRPYRWHRAMKNGDSSFFGLGIPMMHAEGGFTEEELKATALATLGWWHHSLECTMDKLDWDWMSDHMRMYAAYLWELCTAPVLPFTFTSVADQFISRLSELAPAGQNVGLDSAVETAQRFRAAAEKLDKTTEIWRERYRTNGTKDEAPAQLLNEAMKRLSRLLVPMQSTSKGTYGHDSYGYTPQASMIPSLFDVPRLADLPDDSEERWMLETHLVRQRNRVADALNDATSTILHALDRLQ